MEELYHGEGDLSMGIARYLAMTANEFSATKTIPERIAWMACHFSPYSTSLSNLPTNLPANSLLILNDSTPPDRQDPENVANILKKILKEQKCSALLLDFQRTDSPENAAIVQELIALDLPVCVSECYAKTLNCPIFLPPVPLTIPLAEYIAPYKGRQIWLDTALSCAQIEVTEEKSIFRPIPTPPECPLEDKQLHCHYHISSNEASIVFTLQRTKKDLEDLIMEAENLGVIAAVGLYQELK